MAASKSALNGKIGRLRRVSSIDSFLLSDSDTTFYINTVRQMPFLPQLSQFILAWVAQ